MPDKLSCNRLCSVKIPPRWSAAICVLLACWILLPVRWVQAQQTREYMYLGEKLVAVETGNPVMPVISGVSSSGITTTSATISWTTNEASDSQVDYGATVSYGNSTTLNSSMVTSHSQVIAGLSANTLYHYRVKSRNAAGSLAVSPDYTFTTLDTIAPVISGVSSSGITLTGATISWTTNEFSDSQVEYGTTTAYGSYTTLNSSLVTSHSQALTGLSINTLYHYRVKSKDAANNPATSSDYTFTTLSCTYSINPESYDDMPASGGSGFSVGVTAASGCSWTAVSNKSWIVITSGSSGSGNGTVVYRVSQNKTAPRTGTMTIAGKTFTVYQDGGN